LLSRRGRSLPANASGFDTHRDSISSRFECSLFQGETAAAAAAARSAQQAVANGGTSSTSIDLVGGGEASVEHAAADDGALPADAAAGDASFWQATVEYNQRRVNREDAANAIATLFSFELKGVGRNINAEPK
jgi:hypothetical protein